MTQQCLPGEADAQSLLGAEQLHVLHRLLVAHRQGAVHEGAVEELGHFSIATALQLVQRFGDLGKGN